MIVYGLKLELKRVRYHQNTKNSNKIFTFFKRKNMLFLAQLRTINCTDWARTGVIQLNQLEE